MAMHSEFHMPGTFHAEGIFRPPDTTSPASVASSGYFPRSNQPRDEQANPKRKRIHDDISTRIHDANVRAEATLHPYGASPLTKPGVGSYVLAGQIESPSADPRINHNDMLEESMFSDSDYRRMLGTKRPHGESDASDSLFDLQHLSQQQQHQQPSQSWGALAATTLGGVVGRIWQFCKVGSFTGFHAGGGRGYDLRPSVEDISMLPDDMVDEFHQRDTLPGQYPKFSGDWSEKAAQETYINSRASTPTGPAPKRRQMATADDLGKNWVIVNEPNGQSRSRAGTPDARARRSTGNYGASPRNRNQAPAVTTGRRINTPTPRKSMGPRHSMASTPTVGIEPAPSSASFASPRSPSPTKTTAVNATGYFSTPQTHSARRHKSRASISTTSIPRTPTHRRTNSAASTASNRGAQDGDVFESSPRLDPEAKKLAARRKRDDDYTDVRMNAFNKTLQDMIRQGQEALATNVSVEGEGGWEDD